jgi:hypothetical protein
LSPEHLSSRCDQRFSTADLRLNSLLRSSRAPIVIGTLGRADRSRFMG